MKPLKVLSSIIYAVLIVILVTVALATAFSVLEAPGGYRLFVVQSGSMEPAIKTGSVALVLPRDQYSQGDIVTFFANPNQTDLKKSGVTVTHRIFSVHDDEGRATFRTKGDANEDLDMEMITQAQVLGKVLFSVPYFGYIVNFAKSQMGFIFLIIIPATIIIYSEIISIKKEVVNLIQKNKKSKSNKKTGEKIIKKPKVDLSKKSKKND